jgi:hypothetical protein
MKTNGYKSVFPRLNQEQGMVGEVINVFNSGGLTKHEHFAIFVIQGLVFSSCQASRKGIADTSVDTNVIWPTL